MSTNSKTTRIIAGTVGAAVVSIAAPALLFIGAGSAQAAPAVDNAPTAHSTTSIIERPGHVAIETHPYPVTPPMVWGPFSSVRELLDD
jgi:hypothetical protein